MRLTLRVTTLDGAAVDTDATTADLVAFEERFSRSVARLEAELRLTDVCWLAWRSLTRQGKTTAEFGAWLETVDGVELVDGEASPAPLEPTAPTSA
jgi:hypothetical protein